MRRGRACVLASLILGVAATGAYAEEVLHQFFAQTQTIQGEFTQVVTYPSGEVYATGNGKIRLLRPDFLYWDYQGEEPLTLVSDGKNFWTYDPLLMQATVTPLDEALGRSPLAMLVRGRGWEDLFAVQRAWFESDTEWVALRPREGNDTTSAIEIGFRAGQLHRIHFTDALGQRVEIMFQNVTSNQSMQPEDFHYTPPAGTDILGQANP